MPKLTADLITQSPQFVNAVRDRELYLRANKIPVIENLGATLDQFDTIDFSDNDICRLDGFPKLLRLKTLLFNNNRISRIAEDLELYIPNLESLILTNNAMQDLKDILPLKSLQKLTCLSLLKNPLIHKPHYRLYMIYYLPQIRLLDFRKVKLRERNLAKQTFHGRIAKMSTAPRIPINVPQSSTSNDKESQERTPFEIEKIRQAIESAKTLDDIKRLESILSSGQLPLNCIDW